MNQERYVVAVEISSSKIIGTIGRPHPDGRLEVIAVEQEKCVECVRRGFIQNIDETAMRLAGIIDKLQHKPSIAPRKITGIFLGLSGRSMRSIPAEASLNLPDETIINQEILDRLRQQALSSPIDGSLEAIDAVERTILVNQRETSTPNGELGNSIRGHYEVVVSRPEMKKNIRRTVCDKLNFKIDGFVVTALATGHLILTQEEKRHGCMLVDIGAETTTCTIYKNGTLCYYATLPMGSRNITRDLMSLSILEERAEEIKISSGNAIAPETPSPLNVNGIKLSDVSNVVVARSEEIVANIVAQIDYAGLKSDDLRGGIIAIGGGVKLNGMLELLGTLSSMKVRKGELPNYVNIQDIKLPKHEMLEVVSVLYAAATMTDVNCIERPKGPELPSTGTPNEPEKEKSTPEKPHKENRGRSFFGKAYNKLASMFTPGEEDDEDTEID